MFNFSIIHSQSLNDSLLIHYPLNGNATDFSGNNFHGTVSGAVFTTDRHGNPNSALYFNGLNSYVDFPLHPDLKPQLPVSASFWVKFDTLVKEQCYVFTTDFDLNRYTGIWFSLVSTTWQFALHYGDGTPNQTSPNNRRSLRGTTVIQPGFWYFVVGIIRGQQDMDLFINCRNDEGTYTGYGDSLAYSNNPGSIGRLDHSGFPTYYFQGAIDDFRYWNRALTYADVNELCNPTPVNNIDISQIKIFPNPASEILNVAMNNNIKDGHYAISNILGQIIETGNIPAHQGVEIDISKLEEGFYYFNYTVEGQRKFTKKFVKTR